MLTLPTTTLRRTFQKLKAGPQVLTSLYTWIEIKFQFVNSIVVLFDPVIL